MSRYKDILTAKDISDMFLPVIKRSPLDEPETLAGSRTKSQQELGWRPPYPPFAFGDLKGFAIGDRYWSPNVNTGNPKCFGIIELEDRKSGHVNNLWIFGKQEYHEETVRHDIFYGVRNGVIRYTDKLFSSKEFEPVMDLELDSNL